MPTAAPKAAVELQISAARRCGVKMKRMLMMGVPVLLAVVGALIWAVTPAHVQEGGAAVRIVVDASSLTNHQSGDIRILAVVDAHKIHAAALLSPEPTSVADRTERDDGRTEGAAETEAAKATAWAYAWNATHPAQQMPPQVQIPTPDLDGPSLGLAASLAYIDALTDGDLTGGRLIAATGQIAPDGSVAAIGKVDVKARTARDLGVRVLFVPDTNYATAKAAVAGNDNGMRIIGVSTIGEAVHELCFEGGRASGICPPR
jgi:PDZ domain-containing secreted protein